MQNFTLFAHGLAGGARFGGPNSEGPVCLPQPLQWGPTLTAGGGMDYDLPFFNHRFSLRLFQADYRYIHEDYGPYTLLRRAGQCGWTREPRAVRSSSTGIVTHFGHIIPPPPVTYSLRGVAGDGFPGDPITVTGTALNLNPKKTATYTWTTTAARSPERRARQTSTPRISQPGTYTVKGHVPKATSLARWQTALRLTPSRRLSRRPSRCSANPSTVDSWRFLHDHCDWCEPAESSADLQLQRNGWFHQRQHLDRDAGDDGCGSWHDHCDLQRG